ncbi:hypothetical protein HMPREF9694_05465 [Klebsiella michiganensis]|nr:hypothetical protein HMPREF9694_05611 [Klebsiella michiganensis]EHT05140.1 hypothetical protein HMPREF9694_05465 [Klebsiella michiganensis]
MRRAYLCKKPVNGGVKGQAVNYDSGMQQKFDSQLCQEEQNRKKNEPP